MVFESVVADALLLYLGDYVKNLSREQLKISVFSGNVVLNNLELKGEALHAFNLPFHVFKGFIGSLRLIVPWQNLRTQPVIVEIEQIYALARPQSMFKHDEHEEAVRVQREKQKRLNQYELMRQYKTNPTNEKDGFVSSLLTKIVDNIQVKINQVHIRYEDKRKRENFALGVCIDQLSVYSVDANGAPCFIDSSPTATIHKVVKMTDFSIYLDSDIVPAKDTITNDELATLLSGGIASHQKLCSHTFIVKPVSAEVKLTMNKGMRFEKIPKSVANCMFEEFAFCIEEKQFQVLLKVLSYINNYAQEMKYLKWRPKVRPSGDPAAWWRYAGTIIRKGIRTKREERSWSHILDSLHKRKEYVALFKRTQQIADWLSPLSAEEKKRLEGLEEHLPFEKIVFFRNIARAELNKELPIAKEKKAALLKQKKGWFGFVSSFVNDAPKFDIQLTPEEMNEIYSIIDYNDMSSDIQQPKDFVRFETNFVIKAVSLSVFGSSSQRPLLHGILSDISFHFEQRVQGFKVLANLGKFTVTDYVTPQTQFPEIIRTVLGSAWKKGDEGVLDGEKLFSLTLEGQPLSGKSDYSLRVISHPLEVVANVPLLERLRRFFTPEESLSFAGFSSMADKFNSIKEMTQLQLMDVLHHHKTIDLSMDIKAPVLIVPENPSQSDTLLAFFDLGNFTIQSDLSSSSRDSNSNSSSSSSSSIFREDDMYDRYKVSLTSIKALLTQNDVNWRDSNMQHKMNMHLVKEFDINLSVKKCIEPKELSLTQLKVSGSLPKLEASLSDKKLISVVRMLDTMFPSAPPTISLTAPTDSSKNEGPEIVELLSEPSSVQIQKDIQELENQLERTEEPQYSEVHKKGLAKYVQFEAKFDIKSIVLNLSKEDSDTGAVLARLHMANLMLSVLKRTYDTKADFSLSSFDIEDCITNDAVCKYFVTSSGQEGSQCDHLISASLVATQKESPFYKSVDNEVNFKFHHLTVHFSPPSVAFLHNFFTNCFAAMKPKAVPPVSVLAASDDTVQPSKPATSDAKPAAVQQSHGVSGDHPRIHLKVQASIGSIQLIVNYNKQPAADFSISNISTDLLISGDSTTLRGQLGSVQLLDKRSQSDPNSAISTIIAPLDSSLAMIDFELITLTNHADAVAQEWDTSASLVLRKMKFVLVVDFALSLKHYLLSPFQAAASSIIPSTISLPPTASKLKLDVKMESPQVLIPTRTNDFIIADFGNLMINNQFVTRDGDEFNSYSLVLSDMHISREAAASSVLRDIEIRVNVEQPLVANANTPLKVTVDIPKIEVVLSDKEYVFLHGVLDDTLHSLNAFKPPQEPQSLLLPAPLYPPNTHPTTAPHASPVARTSTTTLAVKVRVHSAVLQMYQNEHPLATFAINAFSVSFEDGGREGSEDLLMRVDVSVQNFLLSDNRTAKASPHYQYIVAPKNQDLTMLKLSFMEYASHSTWGSEVIVDIKSVQFVAMFGFMLTVVDFISAPFGEDTQLQQIEGPRSTSPIPALSPPISHAAPNGRSTKTKIQVQIDSPQVLVPGPDPSKPDRVVADLGDFSMHSSFEPSEATEESHTFVCTLNKMHMRSIRGGVETDILHDVKLDVLLVGEKGTLKVDVEVKKTLEFEISDEEWQFLYATIWVTIDSFDDVETIVQTTHPANCDIEKVLPKKKKDSDDIYVSVKVLSAVLVMTSHGERLAQFSVHDIGVKVFMDGRTDAMQVDGRIGSALLRDARSGASSLYQTILAPKDMTREMVLFTYYARGRIPQAVAPPMEVSLGDCDALFNLQFRKVEIVAMVGFILTVKDMVLVPILARLDLEAARAKVTAAKAKQPAPAEHSKLKLNVDVESPSVLLPSSPTKSDMLIAELGQFSLSNHYVMQGDNEYVHVVTGEIRKMNMKSTRDGNTEQALNDVGITVALDFPSDPSEHQTIKVNIPKLEFSLSDKGWHFLYRTILILIANMATPNAPAEPTFVDVKVGVVSLVLTEELEERKQIPFASAAISNISVGVAMQNNSFMKVDGSVGSLHLLDDRVETNEQYLYREVLVPQDPTVNTIDFSYHETYRNEVADTAINIYMRRVRIIALFDYIIKIRDFIWAPFEYKVTGGEAVVAPPPKEDLDGAKIKIEIESPLLMLPFTISSNDAIGMELGHFLMTNRFERKKHLGLQLENHNINIFDMTLNNANIKTVRGGRSSLILQDLAINVGMELPVSSAAYASFPQMKVIIGVDKLDLRLDDVEYNFIYMMAMQTLQLINTANEQSTVYRAKVETIRDALPPTPLSPASSARKEQITNTKLPPDAVTMQIEANIGVVALVLEAKKFSLVRFFISEISVGYTARINLSSTYVAALGGILLEDNRDQSSPPIHKVILQPKSSDVKMLDMSYETYAPVHQPTTTSRVPTRYSVDATTATGDELPDSAVALREHEWDSSLFVNLRSIKVVTMHGFLMAVKDFIIAPIIPSQVPSENTPDKKPQPSRTMLLMDVASPQILIPASPQSADMIVVELGNITISNEIVMKTNPSYEVNVISVGVTNMNIKSIRNNMQYPFLNDVLFDVSVHQPLQHLISGVPKAKYIIRLQPVDFILTEDDYRFYTRVFSGNFLNTNPIATLSTSTSLPVPSTSKDGGIEMEVDVTVQSLGLLIKKEDGSHLLHTIARFQLSMLRAAVRSYSNTSFTAELAMGNITLMDARTNTKSEFKNLVQRKESHKQQPAPATDVVKFRYHKEVDRYFVEIMVYKLNMFLSPSAVVAIKDFFTSIYSTPIGDTAAPTVISTVKDPTEPVKPPPISFTLVLHGLKLLFLEDESDPNSRAVIGKIFGKVLYLREENLSEQYHIQSSKLQLFVNNVHASSCARNYVPIVNPCSLDIQYFSSEGEQNIMVSTSNVDAYLSYKDVKLVTLIAKNLNLYEEPKPVDPNNSTASPNLISDVNNSNAGDSNLNDTPNSPVQKRQQMSVSSDMIKVTLINDLLGKYDIPFAQILAQSVAMHVENWSTEIAVKCNLELEVIGFNRQTTGFEPITDATPLVIEYTTGANPKKKLRVTSRYLMNINISDDVVNSIATIYAGFAPQGDEAAPISLSNMLPPSPMTKPPSLGSSLDSLRDSRELTKETGEVYQTGYYLYWIANYTGEAIEYYVEEGKYAEWNSATASVVHTVENGQKLPLRLSRSLFKRRDFHQSGWSLHISVRMVGSTRYTSGITVNKIGEAFHEISWNNATAVIACEVDWQKSQQLASKLVTIRTPFYVTNSTTIPIYLALHSPVTSYHYTSAAPIEPGEKLYVPLAYAHPETRTSVSVCPVVDRLTMNWSEAPFPFDGFAPMHYFVCMVKDNPNHLPIRLVGKIESIKSSVRHSTEVVIMAPLTMENLLCHDIRLLFYNENKHILDIPSGESRPLYTYDASKNLAVRISGIPGFTDNQINTLVNANTTPPRAVKQFPLIDISSPANTKSLMVDVQFKDDSGAQSVSLSCVCWIINNTLVPLYYQPSSYTGVENFAPGFDNTSHVLMYSFSDLRVKAPDSQWSIPFSVNSIGGGVLAMDGKGGGAQYQLKIAITDGEKQFSKTRMISIYSHFVLVNRTNAPLNCAQFFGNQSRSSVQTLRPGQSIPFHWYDRFKPQLICASSDNFGWSTGFNPLEVGHFCIKMLAADNSHEHFVHVNVKDSDTSTTISFTDEDPTHTPYLIENNTDLPIKFYQKGYPHKKYILPPAHRYPFTWDDFVGERILMVEFESVNLTVPFDINKIRDFKPIRHQTANNMILVYPSIKPEGPSRVLRFEKTRKEKREQDSVDDLVLELNLGGIGISLITTKPQKQELLYIHMQDILFIYNQQHCGQNGILLTIDDVQIDNQNLATNYPVMLMTVKQKDRPFLHISVVKSYTDSDLDFYDYFGVTMQEMIVRIEDHILLNIMNFITSLPLDQLTSASPTGKNPTSNVQAQKKAFFKLFVLNPVKINLSFIISCQGFLDSYNKYPVIRLFVRAVSASCGVLEDAPLFFNALALNNLYTTNDELKELLMQHYQSQAKNKMFNMLGSANVLGNPVSLFNHISTGVVDFFFEPALGIMKSPKDFGKGLKKGTTSLLKRSVYGTSNSSAKFFGAVSQGVAQWSVDPEYLKDREKDRRKKAKNVGEGLVLGAQGLGKGFFHGVTGLLTKPIEGAMRDGAGGFAKGVAQGLVGVAVKPVSGVLDFASRTSEGISANVKLYKERRRIREPRAFPPV